MAADRFLHNGDSRDRLRACYTRDMFSKVPWSATVAFITLYFSGRGTTCRGDVQWMEQESIGQMLLVGYVDVQWSRNMCCVVLLSAREHYSLHILHSYGVSVP